jgi:hypothetical protein
VFCQLDALQHCIPPNLRQYLNELPETLDETYERILKGINKAQKDNAHRLLQCLTVAVRPLRVEELAELLAFDFRASTAGGLPTLKEDWRWDDEEEAVLSTCSSLITIIPRDDSRVVQFSHFSVKEYLTSSRLARSPNPDVSLFHIDLEPAHTVMAQACLATLLRLEGHIGKCDAKVSPLLKYAAQHWVDHAQFDNVSSRVRDGTDDLFDSSKPYFARWLQVHDIDIPWSYFTPSSPAGVGSPLYYAASCGFYDLAARLIMKHPEQVNARGGRNLFPLPAALHRKYFSVADLLHKHGAVVDVRGDFERTQLDASIGVWGCRYHTVATRSRRRCKCSGQCRLDTTVHGSLLYASRGCPGPARTHRRHQLPECHWRDSVVRGLDHFQLFPRGKNSRHRAGTTGAWGRPECTRQQPLNSVT